MKLTPLGRKVLAKQLGRRASLDVIKTVEYLLRTELPDNLVGNRTLRTVVYCDGISIEIRLPIQGGIVLSASEKLTLKEVKHHEI